MASLPFAIVPPGIENDRPVIDNSGALEQPRPKNTDGTAFRPIRIVMAGLVPAIHVLLVAAKTWMPGSESPHTGPPKAGPGRRA
jgi:hypothetical protein